MKQELISLTAETTQVYNYIKDLEESLSSTMSAILNRQCIVEVH